MKNFVKHIITSTLGTLLALFCIILFAFLIILGTRKQSYDLKHNTIVEIRLDGVLKDHTQSNPLLKMLGLEEVNEVALGDITDAIKKAKENEKIDGIYIKSGFLSAPSASLLEIRNQLLDFKESGKFIIAYGDTYTQGSYYLASVADKVILNPQGNLDLHGLSSTRMFYKGLFDLIGVDIQVFKVGTYKSAVEPYIQEKMSDANREQVKSFSLDMWHTISNDIAQSRNISIESLNKIADTLTLMRQPTLIVDMKLADTLMYETDVKKHLAKLVGKEKKEDLRLANIDNLKSVNFINNTKHSDQIAILYAEGSIMSGNSSDDIYDKYYIKQIERLQENKKIKAVVLRVNSPGGSAYASEQIWKALSDLKAEKPIIVSMGGYAASGGYYISCNANKIIAQPTTLTGSIGIFGMFPNVEGLTKKLGLSFDNVKTNKFGDFGDLTRPMRDDEKAILQEYINNGYELFIQRCADGRGLPVDSIKKIAEGRVWTGKQALEIGLVDALGGLDLAIEEAAKYAKLETYSVVEYPKQKNFWASVIQDARQSIAANTLKEYIGDDIQLLKTIKEIKSLKEQDFVQARLPYDFNLK